MYTWLRSDVVHTIVKFDGKQLIEVLPPFCTDQPLHRPFELLFALSTVAGQCAAAAAAGKCAEAGKCAAAAGKCAAV